MKITEHSAEFYESLAYIFYAMAAVDNQVRIAEKRKIKELVDKDWTFVSDELNSTEIIFSVLKKLFSEQFDKEEAFLNFKEFFLEHNESFSEGLKTKILDTTDKIAMSFAGRNKSESVLISRLYFLMWKSDRLSKPSKE